MNKQPNQVSPEVIEGAKIWASGNVEDPDCKELAPFLAAWDEYNEANGTDLTACEYADVVIGSMGDDK